MLELGVTFSFEQLVIDNDIISMIKKAMDGIPVNDYTLAVDAIKEVGVGNDFIGHMTTMDNMDLPSDPLVINRDMIGDWRAAGCKNLADAAHEVVEGRRGRPQKPHRRASDTRGRRRNEGHREEGRR